MLGRQRRQFAFDLLDRVVGVRTGKEIKDIGGARERVAGRFQRVDGVGEGRLDRIGGDGRDLGLVGGKGAREGRQKMLRFDPAEGRDAEWLGPVLEQRVGVGGLRCECLVRLIHGGHMGFEFLHCTLGEDPGQRTSGTGIVLNFSDVKQPPRLLS